MWLFEVVLSFKLVQWLENPVTEEEVDKFIEQAEMERKMTSI